MMKRKNKKLNSKILKIRKGKPMKKILFTAYSLEVGGIEKALMTLLNYLSSQEKYDITLVLEEKKGMFLNDLDKKIKIIEYKPDNSKNVLIRKFKNLMKRIKFVLKYKNKFDFSASYATYSLPGSFIARTATINSCLWVHSEYMTFFNNNKQEYMKFFNKLKVEKFKNIVFVSENAKKIFDENYSKLKYKTQTIYNLIDYKDIINKSKEQIEEKKSDVYTFLNVGRHTEKDKKLSRIIEVAKMLKKDNLQFRIIFVGDGQDSEKYKEKVKKNGLEKEIIFLGNKKNPYPYFKIADSFIMTSEYEGFPVVYIEALILGLPIITTNVSDSKKIIEDKYGIVLEKNVDLIYNAMKKAIKDGIKVTKEFNCQKYNNKIKKELENLINNNSLN